MREFELLKGNQLSQCAAAAITSRAVLQLLYVKCSATCYHAMGGLAHRALRAKPFSQKQFDVSRETLQIMQTDTGAAVHLRRQGIPSLPNSAQNAGGCYSMQPLHVARWTCQDRCHMSDCSTMLHQSMLPLANLQHDAASVKVAALLQAYPA
jgi:hypothetical protein